MRVVNRRAWYEYAIEERIEAGVVLTGAEVKSIKEGRIDLTESYVRIRDNEAWLINTYVPPYLPAGGTKDNDPRRTRKLLLHKGQLRRLLGKTYAKRLTLVPLSCYTTRDLIKVEIGLARGKKQFEKREALRKRALERKMEEELRGKI